MKSLIIILISCLLTYTGFSQAFTQRTNGTFTPSDPRLNVPWNLYIPRVCDTSNALLGGKDTIGALVFDTCNHKIWIRDAIGSKHRWSEFHTSTTEEIIGSIYQNTNFISLAGFIVNGATVSVSGGELVFTGGNPFTQTLDLDSCRSIEQWSIADIIKVKSAGSGSGLGMRSTNTTLSRSIHAKFNTTDGKLYLYRGDNAQAAVSTSALNFSIDDQIKLIVELDKSIFRATAINITTGSAPINVTYNFFGNTNLLPNTGRFAIYADGGDFNVDSLSIWSKVAKNPALILLGDSKERFTPFNIEGYRFGDLLSTLGHSCVILAGSGDKTLEFLSRYKEVISIAGPRTKVILSGASNDPRNSIDSTVSNPQYDSLAFRLIRAGIDVYHTTGYREPSLNQNPLRNHIYQTYPASKIIETLVPTGVPGLLNGDSIHLNEAGHKFVFDLISQSGKILDLNPTYSMIPPMSPNYIQNQIYTPQNASSFITGNSIISSTGKYRSLLGFDLPAQMYLTIPDNNWGLTIQKASTTTNGPYFTLYHNYSTDMDVLVPNPTGDVIAEINFQGNDKVTGKPTRMAGISSFIRSGVTYNGGGIIFNCRDTLTGNYGDKMHLSSEGFLRLGGTATVTYRLHIQSGDAYFAGNTYHIGFIGHNTTSPTSGVDINATNGYNQLRLRTTYTPTSSADTNGNTGDFSWDDSYLYIKTSTGWKRSALTTF